MHDGSGSSEKKKQRYYLTTAYASKVGNVVLVRGKLCTLTVILGPATYHIIIKYASVLK